MKRMQLTELFADIKASLASFISILMFVALGMGIFLGISWAGPALHTASDKIFAEGNFHNFQIQFPYGLNEDDLKELSGTEGVTQIEAERQSFQTLRRGEERLTFKVQSLGQDIDVPVMVEGTLPTKTDEIAIHRESAHDLGISVGDTITFELVMGGAAKTAVIFSENDSVRFDEIEFTESGTITGGVTKADVDWGVVFLDANGNTLQENGQTSGIVYLGR